MTAAVGVIPAVRAQALAALAEAVTERHGSLPGLLEAAQSGNADAFAALVREFQGGVFHYVLRLVRRPATAEDLTQDVFIRLWRHLAEMQSAEMMPGWLRRVATNLVIDHWRHEEARERWMQVLRAHPVARHVVKPSARLETQETMDAVDAALDALPAKLRTVLLLRTVEGLSYDELADVLGISTHAVRSRLFRARQELLEVLQRKQAAQYLAEMYRPRRDEASA